MKIKRLMFFAALLLTFASGAWATPEPQVIWCSGNHTLYFTYAEPVPQGSSYNGQTADRVYSGNDFNYAKWGDNSDITGNCTTVVFESSFSSARPTKCTYWFLFLGVLTNIQGIENLNTSEVTNMGSMFANCVGLTSLDLSHFNTALVTDMESMFKNCTKLTTLDLSSFDTSNVETMSEMFSGCSALTSLTVATGWTKITSYSDRFKNCTPSTIHLVMDDDKDSHSLLEEFSELISGKAVNVTLRNRTLLKDGNWNTLCLPFSMDATQIAASSLNGATIKEMNASTSNLDGEGLLTLNFSQVTSIEAGKPYIVKWETTGDNISNPTLSGVTITSTAPTPVKSSDNKVTFVGQYSPFEIVASSATGNGQGNLNEILMLGSGNLLGYSKNPRTLRCFRAHFYVAANGGAPAARSFVLDFGDEETTGIISMTAYQRSTDDATYTLDGCRINGQPRAKGIYIQNGRKVIEKK